MKAARRVKKVFYNLLFAVVYPFLLPGFLVRMLRRGGYAARMGDRFALYPDEALAKFREGGFVWIHAVSVGEVQVAGQLMREWRKVESGVKFAFSTTSSTGWKMAEKEISERDVLIYNPLDFPNFVKSALKTVRPRAVVLTESEIWPNFIWTARRYRIPVFLINARVSDRSAPRYKAARWFFGDVLSSFARIFAQSDLDATRLVAAGAPERIVEVTGSFKFDVAHRNEAKERELGSGLVPGAYFSAVQLGQARTKRFSASTLILQRRRAASHKSSSSSPLATSRKQMPSRRTSNPPASPASGVREENVERWRTAVASERRPYQVSEERCFLPTRLAS